MNSDTVVAISTPPGTGAIGIVRLSGPAAFQIAIRAFTVRATSHEPRTTEPRRATFGRILDPSTDELLDECILTWFPAPHSYTGEDVVEISLHGNPIILEKAVAILCRLGARAAEPGEFTRRAFLNGKLDLAQAEAVADLISASTEASLRAAHRVKEGDLSHEITSLRNKITALLGYTEAVIDFAEEDEVQDRALRDIQTRLSGCEAKIAGLLGHYAQARRFREGAVALLAGEPNVGKSSLMNRLTGRDVSIVHPTPGTTRDVVREWIEMDGVPVELHDTAGLRVVAQDAGRGTQAEIESHGISKTVGLFSRADLVVWVLDAGLTNGVQSVDGFRQWMEQANGAMARSVFVLNKTDLGRAVDLSWLPVNAENVVHISALTGTGLEKLRTALSDRISTTLQSTSEILLLRPRHVAALEKARRSIRDCMGNLGHDATPDILALDLREAVRELDEITGAITTEDLLDRVFSDFCVGK